MGIDQIRLTSELLKSLYPESLVVGMRSFLGGNLRNISFIVHCPDQEFLPEQQIAFLYKMLSACKISLNDIAVINSARLPLSFDELRQKWQPSTIFFWGTLPVSLGMNPVLADFAISTIDGISVIQVPSPHILIGNDAAGLDLKQKLWTCLKKLFAL